MATSRLNPYLNFRDNAREAMEFYKTVFGGELTLSTFADVPDMASESERDKIMHGMLVTEAGLTLMGADTPDSMDYQPAAGFGVSLSGDSADEATLQGYW